MSQFTDEQATKVLCAFTALNTSHDMGVPLETARAVLNRPGALDRTIKANEHSTEIRLLLPIMHAALATLGPISVHEPRQVNSGGKLLTICDACADVEAAVLDTYAHNDPYDAALWPCPTARAHDKETP